MNQHFNQLPDRNVINNLLEKLKSRNFNPQLCETKSEALEAIIQLITSQASVMFGSSTTLQQIGFNDYLNNNQHDWNNIHQSISAETNEAARDQLRRQSVTADFFIASVNALTEDGILIAVDNTGSRVGAFPFAAKKLILVIGLQKITPDLSTAMDRIRQYVFPKEDERAQQAYGVNSGFGKWVIMENEVNPNRVHTILVRQSLGF